MMKIQSLAATLLLSVLTFYNPVFATGLHNAGSVFEAIHGHQDVLKVTLETDLDALEDLRHSDEKQPALFTYETESGQTDELLINVKVRGKYRRKVCDFAPLMLKFPKKELARRGWSKHNDLKLVTHCTGDALTSRETVLREYLAYELYREVSPYHYRVQLVKITYKDSNSNRSMKRWGIIIEDTDEMAERLGGKEVELMNCALATTNKKAEALMSAYQLMIGNQDYDCNVCRNVKFVQPEDGSAIIPVPYDFDFSGIVNPSYGRPNPNYGASNLLDRVNVSRLDSSELRVGIDRLAVYQERVLERIGSFRELNGNTRYDLKQYIGFFFQKEAIDALLTGAVLPFGEEAVPLLPAGTRTSGVAK